MRVDQSLNGITGINKKKKSLQHNIYVWLMAERNDVRCCFKVGSQDYKGEVENKD